MRHSVNELIDIVHRYYPQGLPSNDPRYGDSEECRRLVAARRQAGADNEPWRAMLRRLSAQFPGNSVQNRSLHLPSGSWDACYSACVNLPTAPVEHYHQVGFFVSFLVPCYVIYGSRVVDDLAKTEEMKARIAKAPHYASVSLPDFPDTMVILPAGMVKPEFIESDPPMSIERRNDISFDLSQDEQPYAAWIAQEIEATWGGYELMPQEVGKMIVPDVATNQRLLGEATLYDCLFSDDW